MDTARCTADGRTYTALEFSELPEAKIAELRHDLVCTECGGPGFFRRASRSGHGACFGARPHAEDCGLAVRTEDPWGEIGDEVVQRMEADNTRLVLNLRRMVGGDRIAAHNGADLPRPRGRQFVGGDAPRRTEMRRNADNMLRMVAASERFRTSGIMIATEEGEFPAREFFVSLERASRDRDVDVLRGFWGVPRFTNVWQGFRIFNAGPRGSLGVEISDELVAAINHRYGLADIVELRNRMVLFIGRARITAGNSFMMYMTDPRYVGIATPD